VIARIRNKFSLKVEYECMKVMIFLAIYLVIMNVIGFSSMGIDKKKAIKRDWRIPEATLFMFAMLGGSIGSTFGMYAFRHKTKHWYFVIGMPLILILQIALIVYVITHVNISIM